MGSIISNKAVQTYLSSLAGRDLLISLDWQTFVDINAPYSHTRFSEREVQTRYHRNGYDWDIHGTLYVPSADALPGYAFVLIHGGGVNELDFQSTPDGRPGLARVLAAQGLRVLTPSYPGLWPPQGKWSAPIQERKPFYLLDRTLGDEEINDRLLKATYQVYMQGITQLVEDHLSHHYIFAMGHSTGGPMAADLYRNLTSAQVKGILGWGSGGFDGWIARWRDTTGAPILSCLPGNTRGDARPLGTIIYRTVEEYKNSAGYEDSPELTPWGGMEQRFQLGKDSTPTFNPELQVVSHQGNLARLEEYRRATGLPRSEYCDHLGEPDAHFLSGIKVLLMVGENDKNHWQTGGQRVEERQDGFVAKLYREKTGGAHLVVVPKLTHMGHWALHNENLVYLWLWAIKSGYFDRST